MGARNLRIAVAAVLALALIAGIVVVTKTTEKINRTNVVAYFANSNGIFTGDEVRILGVPVGKIEKIEPEPQRAKITFWVEDKYKVPADAKAVILSPTLVTARTIQLTPAYSTGPTLQDNSVIPEDRTAVPVEWDDFRIQLQKLTDTLQPTEKGGTSPLGQFINTSAANLRGQGADIRQTIIELSQAFSALGDHSDDLFGTFKNVQLLVTALHDSSDILVRLNQNLSAVTGLLADDPNEIANAVRDINDVSGAVQSFVAENRETLGTTSDKIASTSQAVVESLDDVKQLLHILPNALSNFVNIYEPAQGALTGALAINNFANPVQFICSGIQAASKMNNEQSAKLCVQYLAPIMKNRQYNFPPFGANPFVGVPARPNELTYSEPWLRPDFVPPTNPPPAQHVPGDEPFTPGGGGPVAPPPPPPASAPLAAESGTAPAPVLPEDGGLPAPDAQSTDPNAGLAGLMVPPGGGS